jgi:hypothetical protein
MMLFYINQSETACRKVVAITLAKYLMSRRHQQSENALFIFSLLKDIIQPLGAKDFDLNQGAKLELKLKT